MYINDFIFDGKWLSTFNCMTVTFNQDGSGTYDLGGNAEFVTGKSAGSYRDIFYGATYEEPLTATIQIAKKDSALSPYFSYSEISEITRWLNRRNGYHELKFLSDEVSFPDVYYMAKIVAKAITLPNTNIVGLELEVTTDRPWANMDRTQTGTTTSTSGLTLVNNSDHIGEIPMILEVTPTVAGALKITNSMFPGIEVNITGCTAGETIKINGANLVISTTGTNLPKRFNWVFPRIGSTLANRNNVIKTSLLSNITCKWTEAKKVGLGV